MAGGLASVAIRMTPAIASRAVGVLPKLWPPWGYASIIPVWTRMSHHGSRQGCAIGGNASRQVLSSVRNADACAWGRANWTYINAQLATTSPQ